MADGNKAVPGDEPPAKEQANEHVKAFFLDLAANGTKEEWNKWRHDPANEGMRVTFAGIDFGEAPKDEIDFSRFEFGNGADFSRCKWRGAEWEIQEVTKPFKPGCAWFTGAVFGDDASFDRAVFGEDARFDRAVFGDDASFGRAVFGDDASFEDLGDWTNFTATDFGDRASFRGTAFDQGVNFENALFGGSARFDGATFGHLAIFTSAAFRDTAQFICVAVGFQAKFTGAAFGNWANFTGAAFGDFARFNQTIFAQVEFTGKSEEQSIRQLEVMCGWTGEEALMALKQRHKKSWKDNKSGPERFLNISFERARFYSLADFSGRSFELVANFSDTRFYFPPDFNAVTNAARIDFTGTHVGFVPPGGWHWTKQGRNRNCPR